MLVRLFVNGVNFRNDLNGIVSRLGDGLIGLDLCFNWELMVLLRVAEATKGCNEGEGT